MLIVFDIGNVLLRYDVERVARNFGRLHPGTGAPLVKALWFSPLNKPFESGRLTGHRLFRLLKKKHRLPFSYSRFCGAFNNTFTPIPENMGLLRRLARRHPVALLSNTNDIHWRHIFKKYPALRLARWAFSSHRLKMMKPNPRVYRLLSKKTGVPLRDTVYIDDRKNFVRAARRLGMTALHYDGTRALGKKLQRLGLLGAALLFLLLCPFRAPRAETPPAPDPARARDAFDTSWRYYQWRIEQGGDLKDLENILRRILEKYGGAPVDLTLARRELAVVQTLKGAAESAGQKSSAPHKASLLVK